MNDEAEYYRELRSQTKTELIAEIRSLRGRIDEHDESNRAEKRRIYEASVTNKVFLEKKYTIRFSAALTSLAAFGIGYAYSPGLLRLMACLLVIYLFGQLMEKS